MSESVDYNSMESPQLFRVAKSDSLPFSPSQVGAKAKTSSRFELSSVVAGM